jgi:hypothetical protein
MNKTDYPVVVRVFFTDEDGKTAVPADVTEILKSSDTTALALMPRSEYKILIGNVAGKKQWVRHKTN